MKVLLLGDATRNNGPSNVHKELLKHWPSEDDFDYINHLGKVSYFLEGLRRGMAADVVISLCMNLPSIEAHHILHRLGKPIVCFVHGYVAFENEINHLGHSERWLESYRRALREADLIVANSALQARFVLGYQPELAEKMQSITLGVERFKQMPYQQPLGRAIVSVSGGNRYIKGNDVVAKACKILRDRGVPCELNVYGSIYEQGSDFYISALSKGEGRVLGQVNHEKFLKGLNQSSLFVMNSRHEPFGLSALDAIQSGVSVLISKNCGVLEVLSPKGSDVIENCEDPVEVADKMEYVLTHPNGRRLYEALDWGKLNWDIQARRLREMCAKVSGL